MATFSIDAAIERFKLANADDPNCIVVDGQLRPRELVQAERLARWIDQLEPNPSQALQLAAHCQHLRRWEIPRESFPAGRVGYLKWRKQLSKFHADAASGVLRELGANESTISAVRAINQKHGLLTNPDAQTMEDALCLTFLEYEATDFGAKHEPEKVTQVLRKTWQKMSPRGRRVALKLRLPDGLDQLLRAALADDE